MMHVFPGTSQFVVGGSYKAGGSSAITELPNATKKMAFDILVSILLYL